MRRYGSFLVRWWQAEPGQQRLSIRHVQSDEELTVAALADALAWMADCLADPNRAPPRPPPGNPAKPQSEGPKGSPEKA
jgi:hypothetical protein